jgi:hypothetical protein
MRAFRLVWFVACSVGIGISIAAACGATSLLPQSTRELALSSSDIVIGTVAATHSYWNPAHTRILTDVSFDVSESLEGVPGGRLTLTQFGGERDGIRVSVPGGPLFVPGQQSLLFVWRDSPGRPQVNGLAMGKFDIRQDPETGERLVQRTAPGFAVRDLRTLRALTVGELEPRLRLDDLVREIRHDLEVRGR